VGVFLAGTAATCVLLAEDLAVSVVPRHMQRSVSAHYPSAEVSGSGSREARNDSAATQPSAPPLTQRTLVTHGRMLPPTQDLDLLPVRQCLQCPRVALIGQGTASTFCLRFGTRFTKA